MKGLALLAATGTSVLFGLGRCCRRRPPTGSSLSGGLMRRLLRQGRYLQRELADMRHDIFEDRHGFEARRRRFLGVAA